VETVLMHMLRGSGLSGLAGMLPRSSWPTSAEEGRGLLLVRPLLEVRRSETEAYCREMDRRPLEDATNRSLRFRRNVVRYQLLPLLREHVRGVDATLLRLARAAATEREALNKSATEVLDRAGSVENWRVHLSLTSLRRAPEGLLPQVMRLAASRLLGDARDIGERHLLAMAAAVRKPAGTELDLPRGLRVRVDYNEIVLALNRSRPEVEALPVQGVVLAVPGGTSVAGWRFEASLTNSDRQATGNEWEARLDADSVQGALLVRRRRPGDRYRPLGMTGDKKLQDVFVDAKVPRWQRDGVPVVCDNTGIVWVAGYRVAERVKVTVSTRRTVRLGAGRESRGS
jgi:tRNA(Ile)-lysidine synthase